MLKCRYFRRISMVFIERSGGRDTYGGGRENCNQMHLSATHKGGTRGGLGGEILGRVVIRCTFLLRIKAAQGGNWEGL